MLNNIKEIIEDYIKEALYGIFFTKNIMGDRMTTIYKDDKYTVDICLGYGYFEIFGCTTEEEAELVEYYEIVRNKYYDESDNNSDDE